MQVPIFRAKDMDSDEYVEGFYVEYPATSNVDIRGLSVQRCIFVYKPGAFGLINEPYVCSIDITTLEFVRYTDIPCANIPVIINHKNV